MPYDRLIDLVIVLVHLHQFGTDATADRVVREAEVAKRLPQGVLWVLMGTNTSTSGILLLVLESLIIGRASQRSNLLA